MKKRLLSIVFSVLLCILCYLFVYADTEKQYTFDYTGSLTDEELLQLDELAEAISVQYDIDAYFVMTNDTGDLGTVDYTEAFYEEYASDSNCVIFTLTTDEYYVLPLGKCADIFTELEFEMLYDAYITCEKKYDGISAYYSEVTEIIQSFQSQSQIVVETDDFQGLRMNDDADIIEDITEVTVSDEMDEISTQYACDVAIFTSASIPKTGYAAEYYISKGYGAGDSDFGIIFVINTANGYWDVVPMGDSAEEKVFTDAGIKYIKKQLKSLVDKGKYSKAAEKYAELCRNFLKQAETGEPYDENNLPKDPLDPGVIVLVVIAGVAVVVVAAVLFKRYRKKG